MKIGIQTWGSDGDIRPFIALAGGLSAAGHEVTLAVTSVDGKDYSSFAGSMNINLHHVGCLDLSPEKSRLLAGCLITTRNVFRQLTIIMDMLYEPAADDMYIAAEKLCAENDLLIGHFMLHPLQAAAEKAGKPYLTVTLNHSGIPSRYTPISGMPDLGGFFNNLAWKCGLKLMNSRLLRYINGFRSRKGFRLLRDYREAWESKRLNLIAVSSVFREHMPDWEAHHRVTGFLGIPQSAEEWNMPEELRAFLDAGPPPVYFTFGSMFMPGIGDEYSLGNARLMADAVRMAGCRAIIQAPWREIPTAPEDAAIFTLSKAPHSRLFPHCAAVVHHGGAGTTHSATLYGCPSVVVAHVLDQTFWGNELRRLGIAPKILFRGTVTARALAAAVGTVLNSPGMRERAAALGERMRREDGVSQAVGAVSSAYLQDRIDTPIIHT